MSRGAKLVVGSIVGTILAIAVVAGALFGPRLLQLWPQPRTELTIKLAEANRQAADQTIEVLSRRLNSLKLDPAFRLEDDATIVVDIPRPTDTTRLKAVLVAPGKLEFRRVDMSVGVADAQRGRMPLQSEILSMKDGTPYLVEKRVAMSGEYLVEARPGFDQRTNEPIVTFRFNAAGTRHFARITGENVGTPMAIVLDGVVLAAPVIREPIVGGSGQISGGFTRERANDLAILLQSGALPLPITIVDERVAERVPGP